MKSEPFIASKAFDLGNLGVIAPHKAKYYNRYNIDWLIGTANAGTQLKYVTFWHEGDEYPKGVALQRQKFRFPATVHKQP